MSAVATRETGRRREEISELADALERYTVGRGGRILTMAQAQPWMIVTAYVDETNPATFRLFDEANVDADAEIVGSDHVAASLYLQGLRASHLTGPQGAVLSVAEEAAMPISQPRVQPVNSGTRPPSANTGGKSRRVTPPAPMPTFDAAGQVGTSPPTPEPEPPPADQQPAPEVKRRGGRRPKAESGSVLDTLRFAEKEMETLKQRRTKLTNELAEVKGEIAKLQPCLDVLRDAAK